MVENKQEETKETKVETPKKEASFLKEIKKEEKVIENTAEKLVPIVIDAFGNRIFVKESIANDESKKKSYLAKLEKLNN